MGPCPPKNFQARTATGVQWEDGRTHVVTWLGVIVACCVEFAVLGLWWVILLIVVVLLLLIIAAALLVLFVYRRRRDYGETYPGSSADPLSPLLMLVLFLDHSLVN